MPAPQPILDLVERFDRHRDSYLSPGYNETQVRREFIDPLFKALGWDVDNEKGFSEQWKEVVHEDAIKVGAATKAPDYSFRLGGRRLFFLEAKKPSINLKEDPSPAYQLRRYGWTAKLPLSILTDFEEFIVYDTRIRPAAGDKASKARILYIRYDEYPDRWDEIASIFSPRAIQEGAFDKYVQSATKKRGTAEVDQAFLAEIEEWRELLARNIAIRNSGLSQRELNFAVQRIIDRIIFLRICEDRGVEDYGRLQVLLNGANVYPRLRQIFERADERYNSGLFHFYKEKDRPDPPDLLTPQLTIDDKAIKAIIRRLYYPESPYEFSVMPAETLGHIYERFLGSVIRLTPGHRAIIEEKPEVRKAGGVYYPPTYIVDYIVKNTVGKLLEDKKPGPRGGVSKLRVLDPACGSGSFLLGAYQYLLNWHQEQYAKDPDRWTKGSNPAIFQDRRGEWRLTTAERKRILINNIYGVDIDPQAVEVTKLSLLLKVLEGENAETLGRQLKLFHERALPDLGNNIKCGNSLIGNDYYDRHQMDLFNEDEMIRINAFDWDSEFSETMDPGGFDCIISNPPYIRIQTMKTWASTEVEFYKQYYVAAGKGNYDIYVVFVERAMQLLNQQGRMGYILPHKFFQAKYGAPLRELISGGKHLGEIVHFGDQQVFEKASTYTCLLFLNKTENKNFRFVKAHNLHAWRINGEAIKGKIQADRVTKLEWNFIVGVGASIFERLSEMPVNLGNVAPKIYQGSITSADTVFLFKEYQNENESIVDVWSKELNCEVKIERDILKPVVRSGKIGRYSANPTALVLFPYKIKKCAAQLYTTAEMREQYPLAWAYLNQNKRLLENREGGKFKDQQWYRFGRSQNLGMWEQPKLMIPYMIKDLAAYYDQNDSFYFINVTTGGYGIIADETMISYPYLCGLLNSRLLDFYLKQVSTSFRGGYLAANKQFIEQLPIRTINFDDPDEITRHDKMISLVERMLDLNKRLVSSTAEHNRTLLKRQIAATDRQIDQMVYELYGLTDDEILIVEQMT